MSAPLNAPLRLALVRHGITEWNEAHRIQGRTNVPLSPAGRAALDRLRLPAALAGAAWMASPLSRAVETAERLGARAITLVPRLIEMAWGDWEGETLEALRARLGPAMAAEEARGIDFHPPRGESPRMVAARLTAWLADLARAPPAPMVAAITHRGVLRAAMVLALDWDMTNRAPVRLERDAAHLFDVTPAGGLVHVAFNVAFEARDG
jgi:probable phosphoglycerate mutase